MSQTKIGFVVFAYCRAFVIVIEDISLFIVWNLINEPKDLDDLTLTSMLSSEIIITLHFSIGYHPTHNKKRQWWSSQLLTRGTYAGVIENLFWWHQFVEILKTLYHYVWTEDKLLCNPNRAPAVYPEKKLIKENLRKTVWFHETFMKELLREPSWVLERIPMSSVFSRTTKLIFEGTLKGSWELSFTPGCSSINALQYKTKLTENILKKQKI